MTTTTRTGPSTPALSAVQLTAWRTFLEAYSRTIDALARELREEEGLPLAWYDVLVQLSEAPDHRLRMQELAEAILLSKSGLTRLIDRMERDGLVARQACPDDRRGTFAEMTPAGLRRLESTAPTHIRGVLEHFASRFDDAEAATLASLLSRVVRTKRAR